MGLRVSRIFIIFIFSFSKCGGPFSQSRSIFLQQHSLKVYHRMVKILSTGEIVQDDDPRAEQNTPRQRQVKNQ